MIAEISFSHPKVKRRGRDRQSSFSSSNGDSPVRVPVPAVPRSQPPSLATSNGKGPMVVEPEGGMKAGGGEDREELDFQFDEELDRPLPVAKQNTFSEWSESEDESECDEVGDDFINKVRTILAMLDRVFIKKQPNLCRY